VRAHASKRAREREREEKERGREKKRRDEIIAAKKIGRSRN
jgi:hypothetical protein